uniref:Uncharacterized protein n=1 Tax=Chaetoceros debilis TaxID=122233 RepID=A0A7S3Q2W7_9STRA
MFVKAVSRRNSPIGHITQEIMSTLRLRRGHSQITSFCFTRSASIYTNRNATLRFPHEQPWKVLAPCVSPLHTGSRPSDSNSRYRRPPRPPPGTTDLATLDASPFLDSTLYIKKSSKASHTIGGIEATKRLLAGQNQVRKWIWHRDEESCNEFKKQGFGGREKGIEFGLVGTGVPYQLLQDHVDTAWQLLNDLKYVEDKSSNSTSTSEVNEVVECDFYNGSGWLNFDWIKLHKRDGATINHPCSSLTSNSFSKSSAPFEINHRHIKLYLTVMRRISMAFGTILIDGKSNCQSSSSDIQINPESYWKKSIPTPMQHWKATLTRDFVYPPLAPGASGHIDGMWGWTGPPIVELIPGHASTDDETAVPSTVRITVQGIPTVFWHRSSEEFCDKNNSSITQDDMVAVSLVFEACFEKLGPCVETGY